MTGNNSIEWLEWCSPLIGFNPIINPNNGTTIWQHNIGSLRYTTNAVLNECVNYAQIMTTHHFNNSFTLKIYDIRDCDTMTGIAYSVQVFAEKDCQITCTEPNSIPTGPTGCVKVGPTGATGISGSTGFTGFTGSTGTDWITTFDTTPFDANLTAGVHNDGPNVTSIGQTNEAFANALIAAINYSGGINNNRFRLKITDQTPVSQAHTLSPGVPGASENYDYYIEYLIGDITILPSITNSGSTITVTDGDDSGRWLPALYAGPISEIYDYYGFGPGITIGIQVYVGA